MPIAAVCGSSTHAIRGTWKMRSSGFGTSKDAQEKSFWYLYSIGHFLLPAYRTITTRRRKMTLALPIANPRTCRVPLEIYATTFEDLSLRRLRCCLTCARLMALSTRSFGTPPLRASPTPQRMRPSSRIEWASGLMLSWQPSSSARRCHRQSNSMRLGLLLISTATPCSAQAASTASMSTS